MVPDRGGSFDDAARTDLDRSARIPIFARHAVPHLIFATYRDTQKHANLLPNSAVSFLIDDRSNDPADYQHAVAISACGCAQAIPDDERAEFLAIYLAKHATLRDFVTSPDCELLRVAVSCYRVVSQFQEVELLPIQSG